MPGGICLKNLKMLRALYAFLFFFKKKVIGELLFSISSGLCFWYNLNQILKFIKGFAISVKKVQADSYNRFVQSKENMTYSFLCNTKYICVFNICSMTCQLDIFQSLNLIRPKTTDQTYYVAKSNKKPLGL